MVLDAAWLLRLATQPVDLPAMSDAVCNPPACSSLHPASTMSKWCCDKQPCFNNDAGFACIAVGVLAVAMCGDLQMGAHH